MNADPAREGDRTLPCCRTPRPDWFPVWLRHYDPWLRVRWSNQARRWVIEARALSRAGLLRPVVRYKDEAGNIVERPLPEQSDRRIGWRDLVHPVLYAKSIDIRACDFVAGADLRRFGMSGHKLALALEEQERLADLKAQEDRAEHYDGLGKEAYSHMQYLSGAKRSMVEASGPHRTLPND